MATDVDGTLLGPDERVGERTAAVIERLVAGGTPFVIVTGRPPRWIPPVVAQLPAARLAVCANGAMLYDARDDRVLWAHTMDQQLLARLADAARAVLPECGFAVERVAGGADDVASFLADADYVHAWDDGEHIVVDRAELLGEPAVKLLLRCPQRTSAEMVAVLEPVVGELADLTFSHGGGLVEISAPRITKATGLAVVAGELGIDPEHVVAFGDMPNDLEMIRWAGHGVAMGNAHPALLAEADEITAHHGADGVGEVLERWF